eukprot:2120433-Rhodomonas_salina.1
MATRGQRPVKSQRERGWGDESTTQCQTSETQAGRARVCVPRGSARKTAVCKSWADRQTDTDRLRQWS